MNFNQQCEEYLHGRNTFNKMNFYSFRIKWKIQISEHHKEFQLTNTKSITNRNSNFPIQINCYAEFLEALMFPKRHLMTSFSKRSF